MGELRYRVIENLNHLINTLN
ncbi:hypothetical protein BCEN4_740044 [Burkholderia cenocepacia]|nr:hypothetical protein BCEN4_740044 [Burkholderia cenocepacia]